MMYDSKSSYRAYFIFVLMVLCIYWHFITLTTIFVIPKIPTESIRLRILAHSDMPNDQALKLIVRNAVTKQIEAWVGNIEHISEARATITSRIPEIKQTIASTLKTNNANYSFQVELAKVPFPTKIYGHVVYPAGMYEALKITIGSGKGRNWWCVLFPPLCFFGVKTTQTTEQPSYTSTVNNQQPTYSFIEKLPRFLIKSKKDRSMHSPTPTKSEKAKQKTVTIRFYLWDKWKAWFS